MRSQSRTGIVAGIAICLATPAAAQSLGACPTAQVTTPAQVDARWETTRAAEAREGLVRTIELASRWRRTPSYIIERASQNGSDEVSTVRQAGPWRRIDHTRGRHLRSEYINLETGVRVVLRRYEDDNRSDTNFEATRPRASETWRRWRMARTERRETHLGERCTVTRFDPVDARPNLEFPAQPTEICTTRDGIELWRRTESPPGMNNGAPMEFLVTTRLSRERVSLEDVRPPREMLAWDYWRERAIEESDEAPTRREPDHAICYQGADGWGTKEVRLAGEWNYTLQRTELLWISGRGLQLTLLIDDGGEPYSLSARAWRPAQRHHAMRLNFADGDRTETILGERCAWHMSEITLGGEPPTSWCITEDNVTLATLFPNFTATALRRAQLPASAFEPPELAFAWIDPR